MLFPCALCHFFVPYGRSSATKSVSPRTLKLPERTYGPKCIPKARSGPVEKNIARWRQESAKVRSALGMPADSTPWTGREVRLLGVPRLQRTRDLIDVAWGARLQAMAGTNEQLASGYYTNLSQNVARRPWGSCPALCTTTQIYSFSDDMTLSGMDHLLLMGFPRSCAPLRAFSDHQLRSLSGEGFALACLMTVIYPFYLNPYAPWWHPEEGSAR